MDDRERLRQLIRATLVEGGLKLPPGKRTDLNSTLVKQACDAYVRFIAGWNRWLESRGKEPVETVGPSGSSAYAEVDAAEGKDAVYGDVDYLVSFPLTSDAEDFGDRRKAQAAVEREYTDLMGEYIRTAHPHGVDVDLTLKPNSVPSQVVLEMPGGELVQVDTVVTFPEHAEWMKGRYVPERGVKGYVTGNLFKALGDYLTLTIGTEGVVARLKDGARVTSKQRAGVKYQKVSGDFRNFLADIARYVAGDDVQLSPQLEKHPGLDPSAVSVEGLAHGIVGLADTLAAAGVADKREMLTTIMAGFREALTDTVERKVGREIASDKADKLRKLNDEQAARVARVFGV
jgi:hypothetical protein